MKKVGISLPDEQFVAVEKIRKRERLPRSRLIQRVLDAYLAERAQEKAIQEYIQGYRRKPERVADAEGYAKAAAEVLGYEDWT